MMIFFFKQKTAYEMRISDWSSDVCSSDLNSIYHANGRKRSRSLPQQKWVSRREYVHRGTAQELRSASAGLRGFSWSRARRTTGRRSEEHTSELQSLMRISYAVSCLTKKTLAMLTLLYLIEDVQNKASSTS